MLSQSTRGCRSRAVTVMDAKLPGQRHEQPHAGRKSWPVPSCQPHVRECRAILGHALFPGSYSHLWERVASVCGECVSPASPGVWKLMRLISTGSVG